jgi:hypothetical protein
MKYLSLIILSTFCLFCSGQQVFNNLYGSSGLDGGNCILPLANGEYVIAGSTSSFNGDQDGYFLRINADGELMSSNAIGGPNVDYFQRIVSWSDTEFLCVGTSNSFGDDYDIYWAIVDVDGIMSQEGVIDSGDWDLGIDVLVDDNGNAYILGESFAGNSGRDLVIYKLDPSLDEIWSTQMVNLGNDFAGKMVFNDLGNMVIGATKYNGLDTDAWMIEMDPNATIVNEWTLGEEGDQSIYGLILAQDGDYIALGSDNGPTAEWGETDMLVMRFNADGSQAWFKYFGGPLMDFGRDLLEMPDGDIVISAEMNSFGNGIPEEMNIQMYRIGSGGWWQPEGNLNIGANGAEKVKDLALSLDGGYVLVGQADDNATTADYCHVVKVDSLDATIFTPQVLTDPNDLSEVSQILVPQIYPNPASTSLMIDWPLPSEMFEIKTFDGRAVKQLKVQNGFNELTVTDLLPGVYFLIPSSPKHAMRPIRFIVSR